MRVVLERQKCCGNLECIKIAPEIFKMDEEGYGVVIMDIVPASMEEQAIEALAACPAQAITLED